MKDNENGSSHTMRSILTRDFIFSFIALLGVLGAVYTLMPVLPIYLVQLGSDVREIGVLVGVFGVSSLIFRFVAGICLRWYSEKAVMIAGAALFAATFFASIPLRPFWPFFAVRLFQGIAFSFFDTAVLAFIVNILPIAYQGQGLATFMLAPTLALALAPSCGVFIVNHSDYTSLFLACAGLSLCTFFISWRLKGTQKTHAQEESRVNPGPGSLLETRIITPAMVSFLYNVVWGTLIAFVPLFAIENGVRNPGYFFSMVALMLVLGRVFGGKIIDMYRKEKIIAIFISTSILAMILLSLAKTLLMFIVAAVIWGGGTAFFVPAMMTYSLAHAGSSGGPAVGAYRAFSDLGVALGPMIMGIIIPLTGYRLMFICLALVSLINVAYFHFCVRRKKSA